MPTLTFCGAAGTVTGSSSLIETDSTRFVIDCGMFQGNKSVRELNFQPFPFDASKVDFLILTHAHIDHSGLVPKLVKAGFTGPIYATRATADLLEFMLPDSASIQESNARRANRKRQRRQEPEIEPVYTRRDAEQALAQLSPVPYEEWFDPGPGVDVRFWNAGHILGSASAELKLDETPSGNTLRMLFSGDLGPDEKAFHPDPDAPEGFDYIVSESTYGGREREDYTLEGRRANLRKELKAGLERGGNVVIPAFAVERSQELLHDIGVLLNRGEIPQCTVYLDSPLARRVTEVFIRHAAELEDVEVSEEELFRHPSFRLVQSVDESKAINQVTKGAIIISASGMCDAGRIKHHLMNNIWRPNATVLFVGYQAPGTLGSVIARGAQDVRIHGNEFKVRAHIRQIGNYSAHADQGELGDWILERAPVVGSLFLNHGEDKARQALRDHLVERGFAAEKVVLPAFDEHFELVAETALSKGRVVERITDAALTRDWHTDFAALTVALRQRLEAAKDGAERRKVLARLQEALEA
jgi:metallo-beta-lactamase family protein